MASMNKELLNKILPYCGHSLKAIYEDDIVDVCISSSGTNRINTERLLTKSSDGTYHYKPVLFPMTCINREIETKHGKEIPLIEMAKIAFPKIKEWWIDTIYAQSKNVYFYFNGHDSFNLGSCHALEIQNQWGVFQYLYSRHIAFNLNPDDYVSVESLKRNPYVI